MDISTIRSNIKFYADCIKESADEIGNDISRDEVPRKAVLIKEQYLELGKFINALLES